MRTVITVLFLALAAALPAPASAAGAFIGSGIGKTRCIDFFGTRCNHPPPFFFATEVPENGLGWGHLCDLEYSTCNHGPLWTAVFEFYCQVIAPTGPGETTLYGGRVFHGEWWTFKVVDAGPGRDRIGISKRTPLDRDDGACGARELETSPLVAGDFDYVAAPCVASRCAGRLQKPRRHVPGP